MLHPLVVGDAIDIMLYQGPFPQQREAKMLLLGTCAVESEFYDLAERGERPGRGYFQLTEDLEGQIWSNHLRYNASIVWWFAHRAGQVFPHRMALEYNLFYEILLARTLYYWRDQETLPAPEEVAEQARHWRTYWRQSEDRGMEAAYVEATRRLVVPHYPLHRVRKRG